jgi:beta-lactamase regulating signal transducer with metallopeptidase domain
MPYTVFGLPTHALIIHLAVVGIPAACLVTLAIAIRPSWRRRFGYLAAGLAVLMVPVTYLTQLAGDQLYNHNFNYPNSPAAQHKALGSTLVYFVAAVAILAVALVAAEKMGYADHHGAMVVVAALAIGASAICLVRVIQVGDSGARAAWGGYVQHPSSSNAAGQ